MLTETNLQELLGFQAKNQVLSVYLNTNPSEGNADVYRLNLRSMLKDISLPSDAEVVDDYFSRTYDWTGRSVAIFSCASDGFIRAYSLAIPIRNQLVVGNHPYVKPLASLLDFYGGYGVVLVDKQGARLFSFHLGELIEQEGILGENIKHTKRGGASARPGMRGGMAGQTRYEDEVTDRNIRDISDFATHFFNENNVRRVLIGGTDENIALLRNHLPKTWQSLIVGTFPMSMTASKEDVFEKALQIGKQAELHKEEGLLNRLVTEALKDRKGVLGLDDTLNAVYDGRVQALVIQDGYRALGYQCLSCGYLTNREMSVCQYCGSKLEEVPDIIETTVHKVMKAGGDVEVVQHPHKVVGFDNIGAFLRY